MMQTYLPKRILVTGGAGFIGSHFVEWMHDKHPHSEIVTLDALTYAGNRFNLQDLEASKRHTFIEGNILDKPLVAEILRKFSIDTIVHFAAETHVDRSIQDPSRFVETNIVGTQCLLAAAREYWLETLHWGVHQCRFHMISTDEVYGSLPSDAPAFTEKNSYKPSSPYAASKAAGDHLVRAYHITYGLPVTLSHCSNNYGSRQLEKLIPTVIQACIAGTPIPVYGSGMNRRDWIYVLDHCAMVDWVICHGKVGESYNLGANNEFNNMEIIGMLCEIMDELRIEAAPHRQLISHVADRAGHDFRYAINCQKAIREGCPPARTPMIAKLRDLLTKQFFQSIHLKNKAG